MTDRWAHKDTMTENDRLSMPVTAHDLTRRIQHMQYGEYDQDHDWSPCFTFKDKVDLLNAMLAEWDKTELDGKKLIVQFARSLIVSCKWEASVIADMLVSYARIPEIADVVGGHLTYGAFSLAVLESMKAQHFRNEEWLVAIRQFCAAKKFIKKRKEAPEPDLYKKIGLLLTEFQ